MNIRWVWWLKLLPLKASVKEAPDKQTWSQRLSTICISTGLVTAVAADALILLYCLNRFRWSKWSSVLLAAGSLPTFTTSMSALYWVTEMYSNYCM